jgi:DnaA family protein
LLQATVSESNRHGHPAIYIADGQLPEDLSGLVAVDNVDALDAEAQIRLFSLINQAREGRGVVLAAGNSAPAQLAVRDDLATRLSWGLVFGLRPLNEADRATAVRERAVALGLELPDDVVRYLLNHGRRDLPSLLASIDALDVYSLSLKRQVTVPLVREWLHSRP